MDTGKIRERVRERERERERVLLILSHQTWAEESILLVSNVPGLDMGRRAWVSVHLVQAENTLNTHGVSRPARSFSQGLEGDNFGLEEKAAKLDWFSGSSL